MKVIQNEDEVTIVDDNGNVFFRVNPGQQTYQIGDLDNSSNGSKIVINDGAGTQNTQVFSVGLIVPNISGNALADFTIGRKKGTIIFNTATNQFQGWNGTAWISL